MTNSGLPSPRGKNIWYPETIRTILRNEVYKGTYVSNRYDYKWVWEDGSQKRLYSQKPEDEWIHVPVPAIVSGAQWDEVQRLLAINKKRSLRNAKKHKWLLSGLLTCVCGYAFSCKRKRSKRRLASGEVKVYTYDYYRCSHQSRTWRPDSCDRGHIVKTRIEPYVLEALNSLLLQPHLWIEALGDRDQQRKSWQAKADSLTQQLDEVDAQLGEFLNLAIGQRSERSRSVFDRKQRELEQRRQSYEEELVTVQEQLDLLERAVDKAGIIEETVARITEMGGLGGLPFDAQRQALLHLVDEIVLDTQEQWFEIRGVLQGRFDYGDPDDDSPDTRENRVGAPATASEAGCGRDPTARG